MARFAWFCSMAGIMMVQAAVVAASPTNGGDVMAMGLSGGDPPLLVNGGWELFTWTRGPGVWADQGPFTCNVPFSTNLMVTDCYFDGDRFEVYDWGSLIGTTSVPADDHATIPYPEDASEDPRWSSGVFLLGAGPHSITLKVIQTATGWPDGAGYLRADTAPVVPVVPVPGAMALAALGAAIACRLRTRRAR